MVISKYKYSFILLVLTAVVFIGAGFISPEITGNYSSHTPLIKVFSDFGAEVPEHYVEASNLQTRQGFELLHYGQTRKADGRKTKVQSKYFVCTDCHNMTQEDPDLSKSDPEERLQYAIDHQLPFLQGTTLYGVVNRESWYNGDYLHKYGKPAADAHRNLKMALQLCATTCSQGRAFSDWELESVLSYLWSVSYQLGDLGLSREQLNWLNTASKEESVQVINMLKEHYLQASPATFGEIPTNVKKGFDRGPVNLKNGRAIFDHSCLHCHSAENGITMFKLDNSEISMEFMKFSFNHILPLRETYNPYIAIRKGTPSNYGYKPYMPNYTLERMSNQQVEDLRAYMEAIAEDQIAGNP